MSSTKYLNSILTIIAILLLVNLVIALSGTDGKMTIDMINSAHANVQTSQHNIVFYPVGNQAVRRLVIFDRNENIVYEHDNNGRVINTWVLGKPGENIQTR